MIDLKPVFEVLKEDPYKSRYFSKPYSIGGYDVFPYIDKIDYRTVRIALQLHYPGEKQYVQGVSLLYVHYSFYGDELKLEGDFDEMDFKRRQGFFTRSILSLTKESILNAVDGMFKSLIENKEKILQFDNLLIPDILMGSISSLPNLVKMASFFDSAKGFNISSPIFAMKDERTRVSSELVDMNEDFLLLRLKRDYTMGTEDQYSKLVFVNILVSKSGKYYLAVDNKRVDISIWNYAMSTYRVVNEDYFLGAYTNNQKRISFHENCLELYARQYYYSEPQTDGYNEKVVSFDCHQLKEIVESSLTNLGVFS